MAFGIHLNGGTHAPGVVQIVCGTVQIRKCANSARVFVRGGSGGALHQKDDGAHVFLNNSRKHVHNMSGNAWELTTRSGSEESSICSMEKNRGQQKFARRAQVQTVNLGSLRVGKH